MTRALRPILKLLTIRIPSLLLFLTGPFADAPNPRLPDGLGDLSAERLPTLQAAFNESASAADSRANASVPAAGLLGTIAGVSPGIHARAALIAVSAATLLTALFAANAQVDTTPGEPPSTQTVERAAYALRRKVAWARLSSYLAFGLATAVAVLAATS